MGKVFINNGDLLQAKESYIIHQVNCIGVMGKGVALQIRNAFPDVYRRYQNYCEEHRIRDLLGRVLLIPTDEGKIICNLFGQERYSTERCCTNLSALQRCFQQLDKIIPVSERIVMPYMIGCENGGGDWGEVFPMIKNEFHRHDVVLYRI